MKELIEGANSRIKNNIVVTPLKYSAALSQSTGANLFLKCEQLQITGSFKLRGALNKLMSLSDEQKARGIISASSGNHGAAVAYVSQLLNIPARIIVPLTVPKKKLANIAQYNVTIEQYGNDSGDCEQRAIEIAQKEKILFISPYNDMEVICGQGTIAIELLTQMGSIDEVYVVIGGGGLISGIGSYFKSVNPKIKIIGCLPKNSPVMYESVKAGKIVDLEKHNTLSDATAGNIEQGSITFPICQSVVDQYVLVDELDIIPTIKYLQQQEQLLIEGASCVALRAAMNNATPGKNVVVILSGGNIDEEKII